MSDSDNLMDSDVDVDRRESRRIGFQLMGPVFAEYLQRLHVSMHPHDAGVRRLFVARAGIRLQALYLAWCEARGLQPASTEVLWGSRLLAAKALYGLDDDLFYEILLKEFHGKTIGTLASALSRQGESLELGPRRERPVKRLRDLLEAGKMPALDRFLRSEADAARRYLRSLLEGQDHVFLVDSGWHGTVHRLLEPLTDAQLTSLYFARVRRIGEPGPSGHELVGLIVESDSFDRSVPESALLFHRHLIEAPLEPPSASIERVIVNEDGSFDFPARPGSDDVDDMDPSDQMFLGIMDYVRSAGSKSAATVHSEFVFAVKDLADKILFPSAGDLEGFDMGSRSSDFGKDHSAPVLLPPQPRWEGDRPERRVSESLWPQGQAVMEYGELGAMPVHRALAGDVTQEDFFHPWKSGQEGTAGASVAVVMRTKDRPVLLRRAVASVAAQTHRDFHLVIVNDGGRLGPVLDVVRQSSIPRSSVTVLHNERSLGMEAASNLGVRSVESDYVVIHDDDDSWGPDFLARTTAFLGADAGYVGVVTGTTYVSEEVLHDEVVTHAQRPYNGWLKAINLAELSGTNLFAPIAFVFRRSVYDACGGYPEHLPVLGDWHFNLRAIGIGDIGVLDEPLAFYHHRDVGASITYGNSVIAGRQKHLEYDARVRNSMFRSIGDNNELGHLTLAGYALKSLREEIRQVKTVAAKAQQPPAPVEPKDDSLMRDRLWLALVQLDKLNEAGAEPRQEWFGLRRGRPDANAETPMDWKRVIALAGEVDLASCPPPPDFDESAYLRRNPDIEAAVSDPEHGLKSGWHHFHGWGRAEGRARPALPLE